MSWAAVSSSASGARSGRSPDPDDGSPGCIRDHSDGNADWRRHSPRLRGCSESCPLDGDTGAPGTSTRMIPVVLRSSVFDNSCGSCCWTPVRKCLDNHRPLYCGSTAVGLPVIMEALSADFSRHFCSRHRLAATLSYSLSIIQSSVGRRLSCSHLAPVDRGDLR